MYVVRMYVKEKGWRDVKKNLKRFLSVLLVIALCIGIGPVFKLGLHAKAGQRITGTFGNYEYTAWIGYSGSEDECSITKYNDDGSEVVNIPSHIEGIPVRIIDGFDEATMKKVVIPDTVYAIGSTAFSNCKSLTSVTIPSSIQEIGTYAFAFSGLTSIIIPKSISFNNRQTTARIFDNCDKLTSVSFEKGITSIPYELFMNCTGLKSITIPNTVEEIGSEAFNNCENLESVIFESGSSLRIIKDNAFTSCDKLNNITLPDSLTEIEPYAFYGCYSLDCLVLPNNLKTIGKYFIGATNITSITVPKSVISAEAYSFSKGGIVGHSDPIDISFEEGTQKIPAKICYHASASSISIPESVVEIGEEAFKDLYLEIYVPKSVQIIGEEAFGSYFNNSSVKKIIGFSGTEAERYANNNLIEFVSLGDNNDPSGKHIEILTNNPSLSVIKNQVLTLGVQLVDNDEIDTNWRQIAVVSSNPDILSVSTQNYEQKLYGYEVKVKANKSGSAYLSFSDTSTGLSRTIAITVIDPSSPRTYSIQNPFDDNLRLNGVVLDNYSCNYDTSLKEYSIHLDAYNYNYFAGAIDVFDRNGDWIGSKEIKANSIPTDSFSFTQHYLTLPQDYMSGNLYNYKGKTVTKHTSIDFVVPQGGYFSISNNIADSMGSFIWNGFDLVFELITTSTKYFDSLSSSKAEKPKQIVKDSFSKKVENKISEKIAKSLKRNAIKYFQDPALEYVSYNDAMSTTRNITSVFKDLVYNYDFDLKEEIEQAFLEWVKNDSVDALVKFFYGIGETALKLLDATFGAIDDLFYINEASEIGVKLFQLAYSTNYPVSTFITDNYSSNYTGIYVEPSNYLDSAVRVQAFRIYNSNSWNVFSEETGYNDLINNSTLYNISLVKDNELVQPSGKVKVHIPIPMGLLDSTCYVYREEENGKWTRLNAQVEGNYLVFETDHFSLYAISGTPEQLTVKTLPTRLNYSMNDTLDSDGLTLQLGDEIVTDNYLCSPQTFSKEGECKITVQYGNAETSYIVNVKGSETDEPGDPDEPEVPDASADDLDPSVNGIVKCPDGVKWAMYKNGKVDTTCTTIAQNKYGWWRVENGYVNFEAQGIYQNKNGWWKTKNGKVTFTEFGLFENENGIWRVEFSKVNFKANSIYKGKDGWYKTTDGKVTGKETGIFQNQFGWWYCKNSKVDFDFTGVASNQYGKWYVKNGKVDFTKVGMVETDGKTVMVLFGKVLFD